MANTVAPRRLKTSGPTWNAAPFAQSRTTVRPSSLVGPSPEAIMSPSPEAIMSPSPEEIVDTESTRCLTYVVTPAWLSPMRPTSAPVGRAHGSSRRFSMRISMSSSSLCPPRDRNLMPLSGIGLWLAEIITPMSAASSAVRKAAPGVGTTPRRWTSTPAEARPATTAASRNSPDARGSRATTAVGRWSANAPASPRTCAAATDRSSASSAVRSRFASPRTPSVPKMRPTVRSGSALALLGSLPCLLQAGLLALLDARVTSEQSRLLERRAIGFLVDGVERAGDTETERAGLTGHATAGDAGDDVEPTLEAGLGERLLGDLLVQLVREVLLQRLAVDRPLTAARHDADARDGLLATAGGRSGCDGRRLVGHVGRRARLGRVDALVQLDVGIGRGGIGRVCHWELFCRLGAGLLGDLLDLERLGLLGGVRVLGPGVDLQFLD